MSAVRLIRALWTDATMLEPHTSPGLQTQNYSYYQPLRCHVISAHSFELGVHDYDVCISFQVIADGVLPIKGEKIYN